MNYTLLDTHEVSDAHAAHRNASDFYAAQKAAYKQNPNSIEGERLELALRVKRIAARQVVALGGEA